MPLSNNRAELLADEYGDIDAQIKALKKEQAEIRDELLDYLFDVPVVGLRWTVTKSESTSTRIDADKVRAYLGDQVSKVQETSKQTKVLVKQTKMLGKTAE